MDNLAKTLQELTSYEIQGVNKDDLARIASRTLEYILADNLLPIKFKSDKHTFISTKDSSKLTAKEPLKFKPVSVSKKSLNIIGKTIEKPEGTFEEKINVYVKDAYLERNEPIPCAENFGKKAIRGTKHSSQVLEEIQSKILSTVESAIPQFTKKQFGLMRTALGTASNMSSYTHRDSGESIPPFSDEYFKAALAYASTVIDKTIDNGR